MRDPYSKNQVRNAEISRALRATAQKYSGVYVIEDSDARTSLEEEVNREEGRELLQAWIGSVSGVATKA